GTERALQQLTAEHFVMSALGQKQTYALQKAMSALPPMATAKADSRKRLCLLYPRKRTLALHLRRSALGQKQTSRHLFDHLVRTPDKGVGDVDAECLGRLQVDEHLDSSGGLLDRQVSRFVSLENPAGVVAR